MKPGERMPGLRLILNVDSEMELGVTASGAATLRPTGNETRIPGNLAGGSAALASA
jgi:hypothetical protein